MQKYYCSFGSVSTVSQMSKFLKRDVWNNEKVLNSRTKINHHTPLFVDIHTCYRGGGIPFKKYNSYDPWTNKCSAKLKEIWQLSKYTIFHSKKKWEFSVCSRQVCPSSPLPLRNCTYISQWCELGRPKRKGRRTSLNLRSKLFLTFINQCV